MDAQPSKMKAPLIYLESLDADTQRVMLEAHCCSLSFLSVMLSLYKKMLISEGGVRSCVVCVCASNTTIFNGSLLSIWGPRWHNG